MVLVVSMIIIYYAYQYGISCEYDYHLLHTGMIIIYYILVWY